MGQDNRHVVAADLLLNLCVRDGGALQHPLVLGYPEIGAVPAIPVGGGRRHIIFVGHPAYQRNQHSRAHLLLRGVSRGTGALEHPRVCHAHDIGVCPVARRHIGEVRCAVS